MQEAITNTFLLDSRAGSLCIHHVRHCQVTLARLWMVASETDRLQLPTCQLLRMTAPKMAWVHGGRNTANTAAPSSMPLTQNFYEINMP